MLPKAPHFLTETGNNEIVRASFVLPLPYIILSFFFLNLFFLFFLINVRTHARSKKARFILSRYRLCTISRKPPFTEGLSSFLTRSDTLAETLLRKVRFVCGFFFFAHLGVELPCLSFFVLTSFLFHVYLLFSFCLFVCLFTSY